MRKALICVLAVCSSSPGLAAAGDAVCAVASQAGFLAPAVLSVPEPISLTGPCDVSRTCDYPPPASIYCAGNSHCESGSYNWGWVECDYGGRIYCPAPPPPPGCTGSCL